jgi:hypothetical protein
MRHLSSLWAMMTNFLCPALEEELGPVSERHRQFISVCELARLDFHIAPFRGHSLGRKKLPRVDFAKAFVAKAVYNLPTTEALIDYLKADKTLRRLCGWERAGQVPSEPTFSRAFAEFADKDVGGQTFEAMVKEHCKEKLAGHISRDSTAIEAREKAAKKPKPEVAQTPKRRRGRPKKGEQIEPKPPKRLELQSARSVQENLADLATACERVNSSLKDSYGGRHVRVRGDSKVKPHVTFGLIAICATQLLRLLE